MEPRVAVHVGQRLLHAPCPLVGALRGEGVENVAQRRDAALDGDVLGLQALGIARAVPLLVVGEHDDPRHADDLGPVVGENAGADVHVGLHDPPFLRGELPRFQQDAVGDADLAHVVQGAGVQQQLATPGAQAGGQAQGLTALAHADDVHAGFVVAVFAGAAQAADNLELGAVQLIRPLAHLGLHDVALPAVLPIEDAHLEKVAHPGQHLAALERLGDEILGSQLQGLQAGRRVQVGAEHQHGQEIVADSIGQGFEDLEAVHLRHADVEKHDVESPPLVELDNLFWIGCGVDVPVSPLAENPFEKQDVGRIVVDDEDRRLQRGVVNVLHLALSAVAPLARTWGGATLG